MEEVPFDPHWGFGRLFLLGCGGAGQDTVGPVRSLG